jgi:hypothetical protein
MEKDCFVAYIRKNYYRGAMQESKTLVKEPSGFPVAGTLSFCGI